MPFETLSAGAPSIFVSTVAQLEQAYTTLSTQSGGGTIQITGNFPSKGVINLTGGGNEPVHFTSANPNNPADVGRILLNDVNNVKFSHLHVDSTGLTVPSWQADVDVDNSTNVLFDQLTFTSDGTDNYAPGVRGAIEGGRGLMVNGSDDVTLSNSTMTQYFQAITLVDNRNITIEGNELSAIQGDGIKMSQLGGALIKDNYLHDFAGSPNQFFHSDFIQLQSGGVNDFSSHDVTITGNVLDTGNGVSVQGIWLRNEAHDASGRFGDLYRDITVTDNLIYTASANGIGLGATNGAVIANNTLLWNSDAGTVHGGNTVTSYQPRIVLDDDARNVQLVDNITPKVVPFGARMTETGTALISYTDPSDPNYVTNHFNDVAGGGNIDWVDWQLKAGSALVGKGAPVNQPGGNGTPYDGSATPSSSGTVSSFSEETEVLFSAMLHSKPELDTNLNGGGSDGGTPGTFGGAAAEPANSQPVEPAPEPTPEPASAPVFSDQPQIEIDSDTLLSVDFSDAVIADQSDYDSAVQSARARNLVDEGDNTAYQIGYNRMVRFDADNAQLHELESFGFEMDMHLLRATDYGRFLHFPRAFEALIERDGTVSFTLTTDAGSFRVQSQEPIFDDGEQHNFAVGYDNGTGQLSMVIDGVVVDTTEASGTTAEALHHGLTIGTIWGNPVNAVVDNIYLGQDPLDAGVDLTLGVGEEYEPALAAAKTDGGVAQTSEAGVLTAAADPSEAFFAADFEQDTVFDLSNFESQLKSADPSGLTSYDGGTGYLLSGDNKVTLHRSNDQLHDLDSFGVRLDIQLLDDSDTGRFLHFPRAFEALIEDDRSVSFELTTDRGTFRVNSGETNLDDLAMHSVAVGYDADNGRLTMEIDGQAVDSVAATGTTAEGVHHGLTVGSVWGEGVVALVDNVWFGDDPADVGVDTSSGVIYALQATSVELPPDYAGSGDETDLEDDLLAIA